MATRSRGDNRLTKPASSCADAQRVALPHVVVVEKDDVEAVVLVRRLAPLILERENLARRRRIVAVVDCHELEGLDFLRPCRLRGFRNRRRSDSVTGLPWRSVTITSTLTESTRARNVGCCGVAAVCGAPARPASAAGRLCAAATTSPEHQADSRGQPARPATDRPNERVLRMEASGWMITFGPDDPPTVADARGALTALAEDERLLRQSVREFAEGARPAARRARWTSTRRSAAPLIDQLFELGVMGIEIPEALGGGGARFFHAVLVVEELSRVDPSVGVLVDVQNTLVVNALLRWGSPDLQGARSCRALASSTRRRLRAVGGGIGQRRVRAADARARGRRRTTCSTDASSGSRTPTKPTSSSCSRP